jgi:hypothetical protein
MANGTNTKDTGASGALIDAESFGVYNNSSHVWPVQNTDGPTGPSVQLEGIPYFRMSGLFAPANAEFTTQPFVHPGPTGVLALNADAHWEQDPDTGNCDEKCQAYVMVEMQHAVNGSTVQGHERKKCVLYNTNGINLSLKWKGANAPPKGAVVQLRISFRDATVYSIGLLRV